MTKDGWIYESKTTTLSVWARNHKCKPSVKLRGVSTPFDGGNDNMVCQEYKQCQNGRVMTCMFDGVHGSWGNKNIEKLSWWFFSQYINSPREFVQ